MQPVLLGNTFPLVLIRRKASIEPRPLEELQAAVRERGIVSFWGHANTLAAARAILGFDVTPKARRLALSLSPDKLPQFNGRTFDEVWVLSPSYTPGFRPEIGQEVKPESILGWQVLQVKF